MLTEDEAHNIIADTYSPDDFHHSLERNEYEDGYVVTVEVSDVTIGREVLDEIERYASDREFSGFDIFPDFLNGSHDGLMIGNVTDYEPGKEELNEFMRDFEDYQRSISQLQM